VSIHRFLLLALLVSGAWLPSAVSAQQIRVGSSDSDTLARVVPRTPLQQARYGIVTQDGAVALLLSERGVVLQFTEQGLDQVTAATREEEDEQGVLAAVFSSMVRGGVRSLLNRGIEYPLSELADARYEKGRLYFVRNNGEAAFEDVQINDVSVMENFRPREARTFVARFREAKKAHGR
jgi:hypothetical protein